MIIHTENIIDKLCNEHTLSLDEYEHLLNNFQDKNIQKKIQQTAVTLRKKYYNNKIYIRGLIEISNYCKNDCYYCGIRKSNKKCQRFRLTEEQILDSCNSAYELGFRTFVMQGGEDGWFTDDFLCRVIKKIKSKFEDCAITLSLGERNFESYHALYEAGANRYLLRHETANKLHYEKLHPRDMSFDYRMECLKNLKKIGYQVGCGFMVGSPYQTLFDIAKDLKFIESFQPEMCGIGPFIPHKDTEYANYDSGSVEMTYFLLSVIRIICPKILLPATTALSTLDKNGAINGILAGANVLMPNISPDFARDNYNLYDGKENIGSDVIDSYKDFISLVSKEGYQIVVDKGDSLM